MRTGSRRNSHRISKEGRVVATGRCDRRRARASSSSGGCCYQQRRYRRISVCGGCRRNGLESSRDD